MASLKKDMDEYDEVVYQAQNIDKPGIGEGIAMGFMALGDAYGGAWGGQTDFLGSYLKSKREREKLARGKKLTPFQYAKLKASQRKEAGKLDRTQTKEKQKRKNDLLSKIAQLDNENSKANLRIKDMNENLPDNRKIPLQKPSIIRGRFLKQYEDEFGPLQSPQSKEQTKSPIRETKPTSPLKPTKPIVDLSVFSEEDKEIISKSNFTGSNSDIKQSLSRYKANKRLYGDTADDMVPVNYSELSPKEKTKFKRKTAAIFTKAKVDNKKDLDRYRGQAGRIVKDHLKPLDYWGKSRKSLNDALFEFLTDKTGGKILSDFSLKDLYTSGNKVFYKKEFKTPEGNIEEINIEIEVPILGKTPFFGEAREAGRKNEPGFSKFNATLQSIMNLQLNKLSGAAVSEGEYARFKKEFGGGKYTQNPATLIERLKEMEKAYQEDLDDVGRKFFSFFPNEGRAQKYWNEGYGKLIEDRRKSTSKSNPQLFLNNLVNYKIPNFKAIDRDGKEKVYNPKRDIRFHRSKRKSPKEILEYYDFLVMKNIMGSKKKAPIEKTKTEQEKPWYNPF